MIGQVLRMEQVTEFVGSVEFDRYARIAETFSIEAVVLGFN
jgi:hypothetical protein